MKKIILSLSAIVLLSSCNQNQNTTQIYVEPSQSSSLKPRIIGKEETRYDGVTYQILEVDGNEYLCNPYTGGLCPLVKDTLK